MSKPTPVVHVWVCQHDHVKSLNSAKIKVRFNNAFAYVIINQSLFLIVVICPLNTTVNQHGLIVWKPNESRVALPNVERDHFQQFSIFMARCIPDPDCNNGEPDEACDSPMFIDISPVCDP